jgi:hypothetical protein
MSSAPAEFMSVTNYQHIMRVLTRFASEGNLAADATSQVRMNRLVYKTMEDVDAAHPELPATALNQLTVETVANFLAKISVAAGASRAAAAPGVTPDFGAVKDEPASNLAALAAELQRQRDNAVDIGDPYVDFQRAVAGSVEATGSAASVLRPDLAGLRRNIGTAAGGGGAAPGDAAFGAEDALAAGIAGAPPRKRLVDRYLMLNGYDRVWGTFPQRFNFWVNLGATDAAFKDVRAVRATRLVVPREIVDARTLTNVPKTHFENPFGLPFQYLILRVDELRNAYRGTNEASAGALAHFAYKTAYHGANGRGYIHLEPVQDEAMVFRMSTLASLDAVTLSVRQPSGALLNESRDEARVLRFDYNNYVNANRVYLMVTLTRFFDKNEFYKGDSVRFTGFTTGAPGAINDFLNRAEGHEVMEIGAANVDGYLNTFYIRAPGAFDTAAGRFAVDEAATDALTAYVQSFDYELAPPASLCLTINASLQVAVSFTVTVEEDDVVM